LLNKSTHVIPESPLLVLVEIFENRKVNY